jgi:hypothetical protein
MAIYRVGDIVEVPNFDHPGRTFAARVNTVIHDIDNMDLGEEDEEESSIYLVEIQTDGDHQGEEWEVNDHEINMLINRPQETRVRRVAPIDGYRMMTMDMAEAVNRNPEERPDPIPAATTMQGMYDPATNAIRWAGGQADVAQENLNDVGIRLNDELIWGNTPRPNGDWQQAFREQVRNYVAPAPIPPAQPADAPLEPQRPNHQLRQILPGANVRVEDYHPGIWDRRTRIYSFPLRSDEGIPENFVVTPTVVDGDDQYHFHDTDGTRWVNRYQFSRVDLYSAVRDIFGTRWMRWIDYQEAEGNRLNGIRMDEPYGFKKRKKLRRKYESMPKIKAAEHYESNDYIA